jgi:hypothetical protein
MPERPYTQPNAYKEKQYPMLNLMKELQAQGKLTPAQLLFMAPRRPEEELYDLKEDPYEINNLAARPEQQERLKQMRAILEKWIKDTDDKGQYPEAPEPAAGAEAAPPPKKAKAAGARKQKE